MTHEERMAKINANADRERAKIMEERAEIMKERAKIEADANRRLAEIERVGRENDRRFTQAKAAMNENNLDEMMRLMNEAREELLKLRHH